MGRRNAKKRKTYIKETLSISDSQVSLISHSFEIMHANYTNLHELNLYRFYKTGSRIKKLQKIRKKI